MDLFEPTATAALAADLIEEVTVEARAAMADADGSYETAVVTVRVRDVQLLAHCARGFNWSSVIA